MQIKRFLCDENFQGTELPLSLLNGGSKALPSSFQGIYRSLAFEINYFSALTTCGILKIVSLILILIEDNYCYVTNTKTN